MKILIILFFISAFSFAQVITIKGKVIDSKTGQSLEKANITLRVDKTIGAVSDLDGFFILEGEIKQNDFIEISYIGYEKFSATVSSFSQFPQLNIIELTPTIIASQSILVKALKFKQEITPTNFVSIDRQQIAENHTLQDVPEFLSSLPSTTFYSESGNGIGYSYLSIRGFDQRRISVSINGIPQNDPEDHNVYWVDFPDIISSSEIIQVQRGSSSGIIGYPAIGGSINIITSSFSNQSGIKLNSSIGSYNTRKYSASYSSGLVGNKYAFYAKISQLLSSGYREKSWVNFNSFHLSAVRYDDNLTTQINIYGAPISDGLAYNGLPKFAVQDKNSRRKNYSYWEADYKSKQITYKTERRSDEIENFSQPHFELLNDLNITENLNFNSTLFLVLGEGFFDYDGSWSIYYDDYFRLRQNGFDTNYIPQNALIRAQVENRQWGWLPRVNLKHNNGNLIVGAEFRKHNSIHWGSINYAENLPPGITKDYRYYTYKGGKDIFNFFVNENYEMTENLSLLGELQLAYHKYHLYEEKYVNTDFSVSNLFVNTRFGVNYKINERSRLNFSYARVSREPRLKNYYDAAESSGGEVPMFELKTDGSFDFSTPLVKPEIMNDFEFGAYYRMDNFSISMNLFYMFFKNEIVKNGKVDRFGQPITGNMKSTVHQGIEFSLSLKLTEEVEVYSNATLSKNFIREGKYFINSTTSFDLSKNRISGFPDFLTNFIISYKPNDFYFRLSGRYVGKFYSDNFDDKLAEYLLVSPKFVKYTENYNDAYFTADFLCSYEFDIFNSSSSSKIYFQVNNLFDKLYSAYAIGKEYFPAAERNFIVGAMIGL